MSLRGVIAGFSPACEQEETDRRLMLQHLDSGADMLSRANETAHFSASAWVVNPARTRALMLYHNIYRSWSWPGGHADGEEDLLRVAMREVREETGLSRLSPASDAPLSLEILPVNAHIKRGRYVAPHLHLNLTYLLVAPEDQPVRALPDENSAVKWFDLDEAVAASSEMDMRAVYEKLNRKVRAGWGLSGEGQK